MKIRMFTKMIVFSGSILLIMAILLFFSLYAFNLNKQNNDLSEMEALIIESSRLRLEMLVTRDSMFIDIFRNNYRKIQDNFITIDSLSGEVYQDERINSLNKTKAEYQKAIDAYINEIERLGLNENDGLEGRMRNKIHEAEKIAKKHNLTQAQVYVLQIRRREKDFIMRKRMEYVDSVKTERKRFKAEIQNSYIPDFEKKELITLSDDYLTLFSTFVQVINNMSKLENSMSKIEIKYKQLIRDIVKSETKRAGDLQSSLVYIFLISILFSLFFAIYISRSITKPVKELQEATLKIAEGKMNTAVKVNTRDEIGELAEFFNYMVENLEKSNRTIRQQQETLNKQYNELKQMNITKDKFFSIIAHDLKNPISSFLSVSDFLVGKFNELSKEDIKEFLDEVHISAKNVYELLENLLLWSRSQRGLIHYHPMNLDLKTIFANNVNLLEINAEMKGVKLEYSLKKPYEVFADPNMLNTILRNLITNATKFTSKSGSINVVASDFDDKFCLISVSDTGVGIEPAKLAKLFQLEHSTTTDGTNNEKGTGLGLILCKDFVEIHKGKIWIESELQKGSNFKFTIPLKK